MRELSRRQAGNEGRMRRAIPLAAVALALLAACGSDGDDSSEAAPTTTTAPSPEEAFRSELEAQLEVESDFHGKALDLANTVCDIVSDTPAQIEQDDAANDSPETDAALADVAVTTGLASVADGFGDDELASIFMTATGNHICPEHADIITGFMAGR